MEQHVPMTEDLVEKLTPSKEMGEAQPDERNKILEGIAEVQFGKHIRDIIWMYEHVV